ERSRNPTGAPAADGRTHRVHHRAPVFDDPRRIDDPRLRPRPNRRPRHACRVVRTVDAVSEFVRQTAGDVRGETPNANRSGSRGKVLKVGAIVPNRPGFDSRMHARARMSANPRTLEDKRPYPSNANNASSRSHTASGSIRSMPPGTTSDHPS